MKDTPAGFFQISIRLCGLKWTQDESSELAIDAWSHWRDVNRTVFIAAYNNTF
jgi:hypothetical protein